MSIIFWILAAVILVALIVYLMIIRKGKSEGPEVLSETPPEIPTETPPAPPREEFPTETPPTEEPPIETSPTEDPEV